MHRLLSWKLIDPSYHGQVCKLLVSEFHNTARSWFWHGLFTLPYDCIMTMINVAIWHNCPTVILYYVVLIISCEKLILDVLNFYPNDTMTTGSHKAVIMHLASTCQALGKYLPSTWQVLVTQSYQINPSGIYQSLNRYYEVVKRSVFHDIGPNSHYAFAPIVMRKPCCRVHRP